MKRIFLGAALLLAAGAVAAQSSEVPPHKCLQKPKRPGARMLEEASVRRNFERDVKEYRECMTSYVEERKAAMKANEVAANAAIEEYNATVKALNEAEGGSGSAPSPSSGAPPNRGY